MKLLTLILVLVLTAGCASTEEKQAAAAAKQERVTATNSAMLVAAAVPLFELTCPKDGCIISSLKVGNPNAVVALADAVKEANKPTPVQMSEAGQITLAVVGGLTQVGTGAVISNGLQGIFRSVTGAQRDVSMGAFKEIQPTTTTTTTTNTLTASGAGSAAAMGGNASATNPVTTNTSTTLSGTGVLGGGTLTNPPGKICITNAAGVTTCS